MTQIACAVGMRNAILRNHLKLMEAFVQKGRISLFGPNLVFFRIELIFDTLACFDMKLKLCSVIVIVDFAFQL